MKKKILIVAEINEFRNLLEKFLSGKFDVAAVENSTDVVRFYNNGFMPDVIVADILYTIPAELNPIRLFKEDQNLKNIPVIAMTLVGKSTKRADFTKSGISDFLVKPFRLIDLEKCIEKAIMLNA
jgi:DNA-binding NtrC family response regulator